MTAQNKLKSTRKQNIKSTKAGYEIGTNLKQRFSKPAVQLVH